MTLHRKFRIYLFSLHVLVGLTGACLLWEDHRIWIFLLELLLILSLTILFKLIKGTMLPLDLISTGADFLKSEDLSHNFAEVKSKEINSLIKLFNVMINRLREERIHTQEQHFFLHKVLKSSPIGVITLDLDAKVDLVNPTVERLAGIEESEIRGMPIAQIDSKLLSVLKSIDVNESKVTTLEDRRRIKCTHSQFLDRGFRRSFFILEEITAELWKTEKDAYEKLVRTISHEINNSLGAANSILHSCLSYSSQLEQSDREDYETALKVAINRTDHLNKFMRSYAEVIKLPTPRLQPASLVTIVERIADLLRNECLEKGIKLNLTVEKAVPEVRLDVVQMEQAILNILRNAIEAVEADGEINIEVSMKNNRILLNILDSGPGLSPEASEHIFTPFFSTKPKGKGIGLTLVQEILKAHNFDFSLTRREDGLTLFRVVI